ncbi:uncharacterized protein LOC142980547 [Anticarsia gemmatalis]|uniref:uncharacterized protein LOC142980547 n=1 Tax=Anticarsia gemmatalis TaxID=129554 RepID=UPI003F76B422
MFVYLIGIVIFLCLVHIIFNYNEKARILREIPGPEYQFIAGNGLTIIRSSVELMKLGREYANTYNGIYRFWVYPFGAVSIYNPNDIETIMSTTKYNDKSLIYTILKPWLRDGLLLSKGSKWQERRKILTPAFHFNILRQFCEIIEENSQRLLDSLDKTVGKPIDIVPVLSEFTLNSICETAMGTQLNDDTGAGKSYKEAIYSLGFYFLQRFMRVYLYPDIIFNATSFGRQQNRLLKTVHSFTEKVIQKRKDHVAKYGLNIPDENVVDDEVYVYKKKKKTAMLDLLISAEQEGLINKQGIQEEVDTFMFEGHDTTASGLTFCFMLLANHKDVQDKIVAELNEIIGDSKSGVKMEDLAKMKYIECCIKESLRLYPPVHFVSRMLNETTILSDYKIPSGVMCHIPIIDLHRRPELFENPDKFDPDRFLPENSVGRHPYSYIPFSAGPRNCIGQKFAMMEMKIAVAEVLRKFELEPITRPSDIEFIADLVLRNDGPVRINFLKRHIEGTDVFKMLWYLVAVAAFLCFLHLLFNCNAQARSIRRIPGPKEYFLFGDTISIMTSSVGLMKLARKMASDNNGIYRIWTYPFGAVNIYNAEDVEVILSSMKYSEKSEIYKILKPWLSEGLLLSKGYKWQERRKILTPTFHFNILRQFSHILEENGKRLVDSLRKVVGKPTDVVPVLSEFTLNSICETAMGTILSEEASATSYKDAIYDLGFIFFQRFSKLFYFFDVIFNNSPLGKKQKKYLETAHGFTKKVIKERRNYIDQYGVQFNYDEDVDEDTFVYKKKKKTAMLDLLLSAEKEGLIDDAGIQEEVDTFMFEGHDTTASGLTFCFMILANNKDAQDKIYEELKEIFGDSNRPVSIDDLPNMRYLERCIKESLRLYPPVHFISRNLKEKVVLNNYEIPPGTMCHVHIYDLHRRPEWYPDPEKFDPDRFLPENSAKRHPYAYIPFSAGPRNCIGQKFAMMEMKIAVAEVLREFELKPVTKPEDIEIIADIVLRNNGPVEVTLVKRT